MRKPYFLLCEKKKTQISFAVTAKLISAFVFVSWIQSLVFLNLKFQAFTTFCGSTDPFVSDLVGNPEDRFSHVAAQMSWLKSVTGTDCINRFDCRKMSISIKISTALQQLVIILVISRAA